MGKSERLTILEDFFRENAPVTQKLTKRSAWPLWIGSVLATPGRNCIQQRSQWVRLPNSTIPNSTIIAFRTPKGISDITQPSAR
jgi:hypothetical protein